MNSKINFANGQVTESDLEVPDKPDTRQVEIYTNRQTRLKTGRNIHKPDTRKVEIYTNRQTQNTDTQVYNKHFKYFSKKK